MTTIRISLYGNDTKQVPVRCVAMPNSEYTVGRLLSTRTNETPEVPVYGGRRREAENEAETDEKLEDHFFKGSNPGRSIFFVPDLESVELRLMTGVELVSTFYSNFFRLRQNLSKQNIFDPLFCLIRLEAQKLR